MVASLPLGEKEQPRDHRCCLNTSGDRNVCYHFLVSQTKASLPKTKLQLPLMSLLFLLATNGPQKLPHVAQQYDCCHGQGDPDEMATSDLFTPDDGSQTKHQQDPYR